MFGKLLEDVIGVAVDTAKVAAAPAAIAASTTRAVTQPIAEAMSDAAEGVQDTLVDRHEQSTPAKEG